MTPHPSDGEDALILGSTVAVLVAVFIGGLVWFAALPPSEPARTNSVATPIAPAKERPAG